MIPDSIFEAIVNDSQDPVLLCSEGRELLYANAAAQVLFCKIGKFEVGAIMPEQLLVLLESDSLTRRTINIQNEAEAGGVWLEFDVKPIEIEKRPCRLVTGRDITHLKNRESLLEKEARTDFLSGLSNRREFHHLLDQHFRDDICVAVIDVDHFKQINDSFGHLFGDMAIRYVACLLYTSPSPRDRQKSRMPSSA